MKDHDAVRLLNWKRPTETDVCHGGRFQQNQVLPFTLTLENLGWLSNRALWSHKQKIFRHGWQLDCRWHQQGPRWPLQEHGQAVSTDQQIRVYTDWIRN